MSGPGSPFSPATQAWLQAAFVSPTPVQSQGWAAIAKGHHALLLAPTGSGKTLAAFLWGLDRLLHRPAEPDRPAGPRVVYVSPIKALVHDIERNLRAPLVGIEAAARALGVETAPVRVAMRTGDTTDKERRGFRRDPAEILVTTPESLFLLLTAGSRELFTQVEVVIVDEIHAMASTKRGAHLSLSLERLSALCETDPQRIGLSATQRPLSEVARFLGGDRPVERVDASAPPAMDLQVVVTVPDMEHPPPPPPETRVTGGDVLRQVPSTAHPLSTPGLDRSGLWPSIQAAVLELVQSHHTTLVFTNSRRVAERLSQRLNELSEGAGGEAIARAHHGSVARAQREEIEEALKAGALPCIVATSSLELGIDMGAIDLVVQVAAPPSVAAGLQRVGRAGHQVGVTSVARFFPRFRGDLLAMTAVTQAMREGDIEPTHLIENALDVLAQQLVAMGLTRTWTVAEALALCQRCAGYRGLSLELFVSVLDMLSGGGGAARSAGGEGVTVDLRPRIVWDRGQDSFYTRPDARMVLFANPGTIPDRGLYRVVRGVDGPQVGELDEEMVHESRKGDVFLLGASAWRIEDIRPDKVVVSPAPGEPGRMPFWKSEMESRPAALGRRMGAIARTVSTGSTEAAVAHLQSTAGLNGLAADNLVAYLREQKASVGVVPSDQALVVERFKDELGDWRVAIHSLFGGRVNGPWALALCALVEGRTGKGLQLLWTDDGILLRFADGEALPTDEELFPDPEQVEALVLQQLQHSPAFAARFREAAGRALLLPRRRPGERKPLWMTRLKAQDLLGTLRSMPRHPVVLEAVRECLRDSFDLPALIELLRGVRDRRMRVETVETGRPSPFARSLLFGFVINNLYVEDTPAAERRMMALSVDKGLLRELLGQTDLADLIDSSVLLAVEAELQALTAERQARSLDQAADLLRRLGDLSEPELVARCAEGQGAAWAAQLCADRRALRVRVGGEERLIAIEDAGLYRDALGVSLPAGVPRAFTVPVVDPLPTLVARWARAHAPFVSDRLAARFGWTAAQAALVLDRLVERRRLEVGDWGSEPRYVDPEVLRRLKRRALAELRGAIEPVSAAALCRFVARWQGLVGPRGGGLGRLREVIAQLEGCALPWSELEGVILPARVPGYAPSDLDLLGATGEIVWIGVGALGPENGRVALLRRDRVAALAQPPGEAPADPLSQRILGLLDERGAAFLVELQRRIEAELGRSAAADLGDALWRLAWAGLVTNDTFQPLRQLGGKRRGPVSAGGRWSLLAPLRDPAPSPAEQGLARALSLVDRYGLLDRRLVNGEGLPGGFAGLYPTLSALEEVGRLRRGWFVTGLDGAQFALAGAVDRLREPAEEAGALVLSAVDPANLYGAALDWPEAWGGGARRNPGAWVALVDGALVLYVERGGHGIFIEEAAAAGEGLRRAVDALAGRLSASRSPPLQVQRVNGLPLAQSPWMGPLIAAGAERMAGELRIGRGY